MKQKSIIPLFFLFLFASSISYAQVTEKTILENQSRLQCIEYAISKSMILKNAKIDEQIITAKIAESRAAALPQINGNFTILDNFAVQKTFLNTNQFSPNSNPNDIVAWNLQAPYQSMASITVSQTIFNAASLSGLTTTKIYEELAKKNTQQTENDIKYTISKAYYTVWLNEERLKIGIQNLKTVEELLNQTQTMFENGTIEKLELNKIEVRFINLGTELGKLKQITELAKGLLKFQMGLSQEDEITLFDNINSILDTVKKIQTIDYQILSNNFDYKQRYEFSLLDNQKKLNLVAIQANKYAYYPSINLFANIGANVGNSNIANLFVPNNWYNFFSAGLNVAIPIFDGFQKSSIGQQRKLSLQKTENLLIETKRSIDFQEKQVKTNLKNSLASLRNQERNQGLAAEIVKITKIKFKEGIVTNMEVLNVETAYKEAQANYFAALYDVLLAKIELDKIYMQL